MIETNPDMSMISQSKEAVIAFYDLIGDIVNDSFAPFMDKTFNTGLERGGIIQAGRELVGSRGLFIKKKRYAIMVYDKEGSRKDKGNKPGEIKAMGLDLKRSDTPKIMQVFLEQVLETVLIGGNRLDIINQIKEFRKTFRNLPGWQKGTPKTVNGITDYYDRVNATKSKNLSIKSGFVKEKKITIPGHVQAGMNWNTLRELNNDKYSLEITDGTKTVVCKLKQNQYGMTSIGYPTDQPHLPEWFKELRFDDEEMEMKIIDQKLDNLIGILKWDLRDAKDDTTFNDLFV